MTSPTPKRLLILAPLVVAITPHICAGTPSQDLTSVTRTSAPILAADSHKGPPASGRAATVGALSPANRDFVSGAIGGGLITARPRDPFESSKGFDTAMQSTAKHATPNRSSVDKSIGQNADFYREATDAIDHGALRAPPYLAVRNIGRGFRLMAIGAPLAPLAGENPGDRMQPQFPILTVAW